MPGPTLRNQATITRDQAAGDPSGAADGAG